MGFEAEELALLQPFQLGPFKLAHRIVMAPLTRRRSYGYVPQPHAALHYAQRATPGGLLIAEGTVVSANGHGFPETPGIYTAEQVEAWKPIVKAVHDKGAIFFVQLWHTGRVIHTLDRLAHGFFNCKFPLSQLHPIEKLPRCGNNMRTGCILDLDTPYLPVGAKPVSSTSRAIKTGEIYALDGSGMQPYSEPHALETGEIPEVVNYHVQAAKNAIAAGFDGVELHGAHGFLLEQFLKDGVNDRTDKYGGSMENRARIVLEIVDAVVDAVGADRVGIRLSPFASAIGEATDSDPAALGLYMAQELNKRKILYIHFVEPRWDGLEAQETEHTLWTFRKAFNGAFFGAGGYTRETGNEAVKEGRIDIAVYGRHFLANPDLVKRFKLNVPLNKYNRDTFYTQDPVVGYTDYPFLEKSDPE